LRGTAKRLWPYGRLEKPVRDKHSRLFGSLVSYKEKSILTLAPRPNVTKLIAAVIYESS
jgi:hypothetical protein